MNEIMKPRFRLYRRHRGVFYIFDRITRKRESLQTDDKITAQRLLHVRNEAQQQPTINRHIARAYLTAGDPESTKRTWHVVIDQIIKMKHGSTQERWRRASNDHAYDSIREMPIFETRAEHFLRVLDTGKVATNVFLRRMHNFALDMSWLPMPVIPKRQWPVVEYGPKRAITWDEHQKIVEREQNGERKAFYKLCWFLGGSQGDIAHLNAEDIDWKKQVISYRRQKTKTVALLHFGDEIGGILRDLPQSGPLFPYLRDLRASDRATEFKQRCSGLKITGVTLHSYRYAWAERAKQCGYPERFAQEALGHNSKAVHRAYARNAQMELPSLEAFEKRAREENIVPFPQAKTQQLSPARVVGANQATDSQIIPTTCASC